MTAGFDYNQANLNCTDPQCLTFKNNPGEQWYYHNAPYRLVQDVLVSATGLNLKFAGGVNYVIDNQPVDFSEQ